MRRADKSKPTNLDDQNGRNRPDTKRLLQQNPIPKAQDGRSIGHQSRLPPAARSVVDDEALGASPRTHVTGFAIRTFFDPG